MASDYELAKAYIQIVPTTKNFKSMLSSAVDSDVESSAKSAGSAWSTAFGVVAAQAITTLINKVTELCDEIIEVGMEAETSFAQLETIAGSENIDALTESLSDLAVETGVSASDLALVAYNAISAGVSTENAAEMVESAAMLATAGFTDTASALSVLTTAINAYGLEEEEASAISDSLIQVQNLGVTTIDELASSMGKAISTASAYNVDLYNLESAYVSLTKAGISTEESTTYLSSMLNELGDSGSDVAAILQSETGESFGSLMEQGYTLADVMDILYDSVDGDTEALMNLWSSVEAGKASSAIISQGLDEFNENLVAIQDSAGATEDAYAIMTDTLSYKTDVLSAAGENLMTSLYDGMSEQLGTLVDFASSAMVMLTDAFEEDGISGMTAVIPSIVSSGIDTIMGFLPDVISVASELILGLAQGILESLPSIVSAAGEIAVMLIDTVSEMLPQLLQTITEAVPEIINAVTDMLPDLINCVIDLAVGIVDALPDIITTLVAALPELITSIIDGVLGCLPDLIEGVIELVTGIVDALPEIMMALIEALPEIIESVCTTLIENLPVLVEGVVTLVTGLVEQLPTILITLIQYIPQLISDVCEALITNLPQLILGILEGLAQIFIELAAWSNDLYLQLGEWLAGIFADIGQWFLDVISGIGEWFAGIWQSIVDWFTSMNESQTEFLLGIWETVSGWFSDLISNIVEWFTNIKDNIVNAFNTVKEKIVSIWTTIKTWLTNLISNIVTSIKDKFTNIKNTIVSVFTTVKTKITSIWNAIWTTIKNVINKILAGVESWINGIISGINKLLSAINKMVNAVGSAINKLFGTSIGEINLQISTVSLPRLAEGAVIEPNSEFLAVLGDQTSGRNIETPESLLREIVSGELEYSEFDHAENVSERIDQLESFLQTCFAALLKKDTNLYLDTGTLVGSTAELYNNALGAISTRKARG